MNTKTKKIIAREFLLLLGAIVILIVLWFFLTLRNSYLIKEKSEVSAEAFSIDFEIRLIESKYQFVFDEYGIPMKDTTISTWTPPEDAILIDTILEKLNKWEKYRVPKSNSKKGPWNLNWGEKRKPSIQAVDSLNSLRKMFKEQNDDLQIYSSKIWDIEKIFSIVAVILMALMYPIRLLVSAVIWAIRTLKS
jgi:hypothetical protein